VQLSCCKKYWTFTFYLVRFDPYLNLEHSYPSQQSWHSSVEAGWHGTHSKSLIATPMSIITKLVPRATRDAGDRINGGSQQSSPSSASVKLKSYMPGGGKRFMNSIPVANSFGGIIRSSPQVYGSKSARSGGHSFHCITPHSRYWSR